MDTREINSLVPYENNPRENNQAIEAVAKSIKMHGQVKPIVVSAQGHPFPTEVVCAGHTTVKALKKLGIKKVKVIVKQFSDESEFVDYAIRDNRTSEFATWDGALLKKLEDSFELDLGDLGFEDLSWDVGYQPNLSPEIGGREVSDQDIQRSQHEADHRFDSEGDYGEDEEVMCPSCGEKFFVVK